MVLEMQFRCTEILYHREREIAIQGRGFFAAFGGGGGMLPGGSRGIAASRRLGRDAAGRQPGYCRLPAAGAKGGTGHPDLRPGFLYPLLRLPLTFRSAAQRSFAAKKRGPQLRPLSCPGRFNAVWGWLRARFPRITVRGRWCRSERVITVCLDCSRRAGCPRPAAANGLHRFTAAA